MNTKKFCKAWIPVILWLAVIFIFSHMPGDGSETQSGRVVAMILWIVERLLGAEAAAGLMEWPWLSYAVRKMAHFSEYAVLCLLFYRALRMSSVKGYPAFALLLSAVSAMLDEFHQRFIPGRAGVAWDVLIDTAGAGTMLVLLICLARYRKRKDETNVTGKSESLSEGKGI